MGRGTSDMPPLDGGVHFSVQGDLEELTSFFRAANLDAGLCHCSCALTRDRGDERVKEGRHIPESLFLVPVAY